MAYKVNYPEAGATRAGPLPPGYRHLERTADLDATLHDAAELLMTWGLHERCGLHPEATAARAAPGVEVRLRFAGVLHIPCQVVWAEETPDRVGFGYGSMPGHPERGEAAFLLEAVDGRVHFTVRSFSRPGTAAARLGGPVVRFLQSRATDRFAAAMRDACIRTERHFP
ncbi:DUF1990 domain-containing protein [Glycomyces luteolus]|uniref:DUF1990 domain-containing protein n=1 Tax=Glycomyces luteolus TaxID=2670330 RepID=A0A9X3P8S0_9ACTN|nr:DUF1990 domain-containing protein [Glycomyces luteolus]MDA1359048.1 DUF1990 domain-containing protein [Glycomyces luteolus]